MVMYLTIEDGCMGDFTVNYNEISELLQKGKAKDVTAAVQRALGLGAPPTEIGADAYTPDDATAAEVCRAYY